MPSTNPTVAADDGDHEEPDDADRHGQDEGRPADPALAHASPGHGILQRVSGEVMTALTPKIVQRQRGVPE